MTGDTPISLDNIDTPDDLKPLSVKQLVDLAQEIRDFLIHQLSKTGGHLASNLGTVELTLALHYLFDTPNDQIVWDVGHQTYTHKILTQRKQLMPTLRQKDGLAGFPKRSESAFDSFGTGHSSTSVSAALGFALANQILGKPHKAVAVIGDGAMTAGMAFEALNHAGDLKADMLVILNDNDMSISRNVGGLSKYLAKILSSRLYISMREGSKRVLTRLPNMSAFAKRTEEHMKGMIIPGTLFEELGFNYIGPIDGHDLPELIRTLTNVKDLTGPRLLHVVTQKGKGYEHAENNPEKFHGVGSFDPESGQAATKNEPSPITYTQVFSQWLCDMAATDEHLIGVTPAMCEGSGLVEFQQQFPDRFYDVGIAEQHAVTFAAGLAISGLHPVVAIYSTFFQRAYDQLIHDVAIQQLPVLFAVDRAGIVGADGPTHAGHYDISFLRCIPGIVIMAPSDENECRQMLTTGFHHDGPAVVRYPRGGGPGVDIETSLETIPLGQAMHVRQGEKIALLVFGAPLQEALAAAETLNASVVNMRFVKPLDEAMLQRIAAEHEYLITIEENALPGGAGSAVNEYLTQLSSAHKVLNLGIPDRFLPHASQTELRHSIGLDRAGITQSIQHFINHSSCDIE